MVDVKSVTKEFYDKLCETVNGVRNENNKIEFKRDAKFLRRIQPDPENLEFTALRCLSAEKNTIRNYFDEQ